ncbi:MAG: YcgJ family protein [Planctomycetota bacterium]|uniref:YcgJ family protein n=1 Tax=Aestuariivirga sp. TaxID=2650926 RepID=UPI00301617F7
MENEHMRTLMSLSFAALALTAATAFAGQVEYGSGVFSPERGVVCDREGNFCADGTGISATWTEQYMGAEAAHNLGEYDTTEFVLHNGVECIVADQACNHHGKTDKASKKIQKMVFGK